MLAEHRDLARQAIASLRHGPERTAEQVQALPSLEPPKEDQVVAVDVAGLRRPRSVLERVRTDAHRRRKRVAVAAKPGDHVLARTDQNVGGRDRLAFAPFEVGVFQRRGPEGLHAGLLPFGRRMRDDAESRVREGGSHLARPGGPEPVRMPVLEEDVAIVAPAQKVHDAPGAIGVPGRALDGGVGAGHVGQRGQPDAETLVALLPVLHGVRFRQTGEQDVDGRACIGQGPRIVETGGANATVSDRTDDVGRDDDDVRRCVRRTTRHTCSFSRGRAGGPKAGGQTANQGQDRTARRTPPALRGPSSRRATSGPARDRDRWCARSLAAGRRSRDARSLPPGASGGVR